MIQRRGRRRSARTSVKRSEHLEGAVELLCTQTRKLIVTRVRSRSHGKPRAHKDEWRGSSRANASTAFSLNEAKSDLLGRSLPDMCRFRRVLPGFAAVGRTGE